MNTNRKTLTKSFSTLYNNLDNCTDDELDRLRKLHTQVIGETPEHILDEYRDDLRAKLQKPIHFTNPVEKIDTTLLLKQYSELTQERKVKKEVLIHNFSHNSSTYKSLFLWGGYDIVKGLFAPIHYQLFHTKLERAAKNGLVKLDRATRIQDLLVESTVREIKEKPSEIISELEDLLDALMVEIVVNRSLVVFVFDWKGESENQKLKYHITIGFRFSPQTCGQLSKFTNNGDEPILLDGSDLFDSFVIGGTDDGTMQERKKTLTHVENTGIDIGKVREILCDSSLQYLYYGFTKK